MVAPSGTWCRSWVRMISESAVLTLFEGRLMDAADGLGPMEIVVFDDRERDRT